MKCGDLSAITELNGISYCPSCMGVWFETNALKNMLNKHQTKSENTAFVDIPNTSVGLFDLLGALFK